MRPVALGALLLSAACARFGAGEENHLFPNE